jgi:hypothetical protein
VPGGGDPGAVVADGHGAWLTSDRGLVRYAADLKPYAPVRLPCYLPDLVASKGAIWGGCERGLVRIDTAGRTAKVIDVGGEPAEG